MKISTCRFLLFLLSLLPVLSWGQTYWTAATSRDWNEATNWSPSGVPTATSNVFIENVTAANSPIIKAGTSAMANSVQVNVGVVLTIEAGGSLTIDGQTSLLTAALVNTGTIENSGIIRVEPAATVNYGLYMQGTAQNVAKFINKSGGEIHIDGTSNFGIFTQTNSLLSNEDKGKVVIGENKAVGGQGVFNGGSVENKNGGEIYVYQFTNVGFDVALGSSSFTNAGKVVISGTGTSIYGLTNSGSFTNQSGGEIYIDGTVNTAFSNRENTFTNDGKVVIGANAAVGRLGVSNSSDGILTNNGEIYIDRLNTTNSTGILNSASFTNQGKVVIGANSSTLGVTGLNNTSSFLNKSGGEITIDRVSGYGLENESSGTFTNEGSIQIGANGASGTSALANNSATFNNTGGVMFLDRSSSIGIYNFNSGTINNTGKVVVGANNSVGNDGVYNSSSTFNNNLCGELRVMRGRLRNANVVTNKGLIYVVNSLTTQGTFTNEGVLSYGSLTGSVTNTSATSVIVNNAPTTPIFSYGGTYSGAITIFTNEAATQSAGTFSLPNSFTPLASFSTGSTQTLYAKITPSQGGCSFVVPFSYLVCNSTLTAGATANPTTCGGSQGSIAFSTTNLPDGNNYVLSFTTSSTTSSPKSVNVRGNSFTLSGLTAGDYSNFSLSALGCSFSQATSKVLADPPLPTVTTVSNNGPICAGKDAVFTVNGTSGATLTYVITGLDDDQTLLLNGTNQLVTVNNAVTDVVFNPISVSKNNCLVLIVDPSMVTVNPLPTATITGTTTVCQNSTRPKITFTGANGTAPYTFTYTLNNGAEQTITTLNGNSIELEISTSGAGTFNYNLVKVTDVSTTACSQTQTGSATVTVNTLPTATITGTTTVCQNSPRPKITFMGANGTAPYTFTYSLKGTETTVTTESGSNSVSVEVPTNEVGTFEYSLVSVKDASTTTCSQVQTGSATVTVNPLPTATITGTTTVCQNSTRPKITFTGANGIAPYTFTHTLNNGAEQTLTTVNGNSVSVEVPTSGVGAFNYSLLKVTDASTTTCSQVQSGSARVTVNPLPTATITGTTAVCQNSTRPKITFTGANGTAPYIFTYSLKGTETTVTTESGSNSVSVEVPTNEVGTFDYSLVSVKDASTTTCSQAQSGSATVTVNPLPTAMITGTTLVCQNSTRPKITFTGSNGTAPYTFTYSLKGTENTVTTENGNSVSIDAPTNEVGTFEYSLVSVKDASTTTCSQAQSGSATVTVNPLPTATIAGTTVVCQNSTRPKITFTGANGTAPYTFTYSLKGTEKTVTTENGNSVSVEVPTNVVGSFEYSLVSVKDASTTTCSQVQSGSATVTVNPLPTATITGTTAVCQNSPRPKITFTGANGTAPYTFTYTLNNGAEQTLTTLNSNSIELEISTSGAGTFNYSLVKVTDASTTTCSQVQSGSATVTVNPLPTATISGTTTVCQNGTSPVVTFVGANGTAPYTFTYKINDGAPQTVKTASGNSVTVSVPTIVTGVFTYSLVSVSESSSTICSQLQSGSVEIKVQSKPTITLSTLQQSLNEGNSQTFCDIDANPVNSLQFTVSGLCVVGSPVWRVQVGSGAWSEWSTNSPVTQLSNNQLHRYQAACDASCPVTYTSPITVQINYRSSTPQQVSLVADGVTVKEGESKEVCNIEGNALIFNATCAAGEVLLYSVDGGDYSSVVPTQLVDGQFHNYRVRCRKSDGTPSCIETESGVMRIRLNSVGQTPVASLNLTSGCGTPVSFSGMASCGSLTTVWYNASTNVSLATLPSQTPTETTSYYARCQAGGGCLSEKSNVVTYTVIPVGVAPVVSVSSEVVCAGTSVTISSNCPSGSQTLWSTGVTAPSFEISFSNVTKQSYSAKCVFGGGCQSAESVRKEVYWNAFVVTLINVGQSKSAVKSANDKALWSSQFIGKDSGPELAQSTQSNPTLYYAENVNKTAPRYWTINVDACGLGTEGSLTFDLLATPETGVPQSFNTHENNAPYFMYANRDGWTELYAQNHPAYGFYQDNGAGGNVYDLGLPKGLYKLGVRYWDQKGWGSIYPSTRKPQGNVLAYQEYWFRIQSKDGIGVGAARVATDVDSSHRRTDGMTKGAFAKVMPNPVLSVLRLQVSDSKGQEVNVTLLDASGREMLHRNFVPETNSHREEFGVSELPTGMYFLQVVTAEKQTVLKVVKVE
ncbi:MAG: T9SS type A sorting domain-containing protein [Bacteroidetes bacterium]|nr:T9SS type A sorting domain-containing protein [Bacteroidota bacterium]